MKNILVVDDEQDLCEILQFNLENEGYNVETANSAEQALEILSDKHNLILLDIMMEEMSGFQMANKIRKELGMDIPIIFLTAKSEENDMLTGFSIGGDDYITKPFSINEVLARVKANLKRQDKKNISPNTISMGDLHIDVNAKTVLLRGKTIDLTKKEFLILVMLTQSPSHFFSREEILNAIWGKNIYVLDRTVDVHITRLRKKLNDYGSFIINKPGFGYSFVL